MALDISQANEQIALLKQQSAAASYTAKLLSSYKAELLHSWSGADVEQISLAVDAEISDCEKLSSEANRLCQNIIRAIEEISKEEYLGKENMFPA